MLLLQPDRSHWSNGHSLASRCGAQQIHVRPSLECRKISSFFVHNTQPVPQDNYFTFIFFLFAIYTFSIMPYNLLCAALRIIGLAAHHWLSCQVQLNPKFFLPSLFCYFVFFRHWLYQWSEGKYYRERQCGKRGIGREVSIYLCCQF